MPVPVTSAFYPEPTLTSASYTDPRTFGISIPKTQKPHHGAGLIATLSARKQSKTFGSPTRARTWDLRINSPSLYQLSYRGMGQNYEVERKCKPRILSAEAFVVNVK